MASILDLVQHYQHNIEKHPHDEQKILKCIDKLYQLGVTVQHLQETGVGRTVNALRKEPGDVGMAARALVNKWKLMVAAEENSEPEDHNHDTTNYNGHGHGKDSDDSMNQSRSGGEKSNHQSSRSSQQNDHRHMNGNHSGSKRRYHSSEDSEPDTKKSRDYQSPNKVEYNSKPDVKVKSEQSDSESDDHSASHSESGSSESSDEDSKVKHKIKTEPTEKHKSSSSKHSSYSNHVDIKKEPKDSSPKKSHEDRHSKHKESRHSSEKTSSLKDGSSSSHKSSKEKESRSESKHRSEHKSSDREKGSSSKHSSSSERHKSSSNKESSNKTQKSQSEKHESKSDKHRSSSQSHKSDKDELKSPSEKYVKDKHKSKESSISKDKTSSSDKEKSRDRSSSSKEKSSHSHSKSEKKHLSSSDKSKNKEKSSEARNGDKDSKHRSSSSHKTSKSSSSKIKDDAPKKKKSQENSEDSDDGIDCGSGGLSFAEALGMVSPAKPKKKGLSKDTSSPSNSFDNNIHNDLGPAALLAPTAKLAPLPPLEISALPEISPNYKPRPPPKLLPHFTDDEAMCQSISSKNQRTKVFSGNKTYGKLPSLYELCVNVLQEHIEALEYTGGVPYDILKPVVDKATPQQLFMLEHFNPYLMDDTDHLWQKFCEKNFRNKKRQEMETWREMYIRCQEEQESKLRSLTANIRMTQEAKKAPIKQTKMAYVDTVVKPPRNIARKQALHGTARTAAASPAARVAALASASNVVRAGTVRPPPTAPAAASSSFKPKKAPLMAKALQFMRGKRR